jgi:hypothetical protein
VWLRCGGALPLVGPDVDGGADVPIPDPMRGWEERVPASTPGVPFFGSHPAVIWIHVPVFDGAPELPMTAIGWIGDRYRGIGQGAPEAAQRWWRRLQRWIAARSERVRRGGPAGIGPNDVAAFPEALAKLRAGALGAINPPVP